MNDLLKQRIGRLLDALGDERGYQILDYIEFLDSKYAERAATGRHPREDHRDRRGHDARRQASDPGDQRDDGVMDSAAKVMKGLAAAGPGGGGRGGQGGRVGVKPRSSRPAAIGAAAPEADRSPQASN